MPTTTAIPGPERLTSQSRMSTMRRSVPHLVLGLVLVTVSIAGSVFWSLTTGERHLALALARPVAIGHTIGANDLREVSVALDGTIDAIPAEEAASIIGQSVAASLPAGALLPRAALGTSTLPEPGDAIAALALQPGQVPPEISPGTHVLVVLSTDEPTTESAWPAVVIDVAQQPTERALVVSVQLAEDDARRIAASPVGQLSVVLVAEGGR